MTPEARKSYLTRFPAFEMTAAAGPDWLRSIRREAIGRFEALGFPTRRDEAWRFTSVERLAGTAFRSVSAPSVNGNGLANADRFTFPGLEGERIVFIDGHYVAKLSTRCPAPHGVVVRSLAEVLRDEPDLAEPYLARFAGFRENPFVALNTAFLRDGAFIKIPGGETVEHPIHVVFLSSGFIGPAGPAVSHPRVLILAGPGSRARLLETHARLAEETYFTNPVTEIVLGEGAAVEHCKLQRDADAAFHVGALRVHQERDSRVTSHSISLGAGLARNDMNFVLAGPGAECELNGLYVVSGHQHVDHHTTVDHARPNCTSQEFYKGVLDEKSRGVFNGKIVVRPDAQKTSARQANKNLLLSEDARVNTQPQLEIYADDVKCSHGATVGQLDENALYYLRTRGLAPGDARLLLTYGFMRDITERIGMEALRTRLERLMLERMRKHSCFHETE